LKITKAKINILTKLLKIFFRKMPEKFSTQ
jgi:hypothetical protein